MALLELNTVDSQVAFDKDQCRAAGESLAERYRSASPFPHIVIDDFIDHQLVGRLREAFPGSAGKTFFDRDSERLKYQYHPRESASGLLRNLMAELNGDSFLTFLESMTGISGLISDPYYLGGGMHETKRGGHLAVHADFNLHPKLKLQRRLNLLLYLNDDWDPSFGGNLELWDRDMKSCEQSIAPLAGRVVVFSTDLDSYHGHPDPLTCPDDRTRRSLATYYYTALDATDSLLPERGTNFQKRPGKNEATDWSTKRMHLVADWVPPAIRRMLRKPAK